MEGEPVTLKIEFDGDLVDKSADASANVAETNIFEKDIGTLTKISQKDKRQMWKEWQKPSIPSNSNMQPMLTQIYKEDKHAYDIWQSIQHALGSTGDLDLESNVEANVDYLGSSTIVGGVVVNGTPTKTKPHWHAPPVINLHVYGETQKHYKFVNWQDMENEKNEMVRKYVKDHPHTKETQEQLGKKFDLRNKLQLTEKDMPIHKVFTAEIGHGLAANCVIFPPGCLHFITTVAATEGKKKDLYLGVGAYFVFADRAFVNYAIRRMNEALKYQSWTEQLQRDRAIEITKEMCSNWAYSLKKAKNQVWLNQSHTQVPVRIKDTARKIPRNAAHLRHTVSELLDKRKPPPLPSKPSKKAKPTTSTHTTPESHCCNCKKILANESWIIGCEHVGDGGADCPNWSCEACAGVKRGFGNDPTEKWFCPTHGGPMTQDLRCYLCLKVLSKTDGTQVEDWMIGCEHVSDGGADCPNWSCEACAELTGVKRGFGNDPAEKWFCNTHGGPLKPARRTG